jgi:hypothetical protein
MRRFNKTRVNLKHHGTMVSKSDVEYFRVSCLNFFTDNVKSIFSVDFESISLVSFVMIKAAKEHLEKAEHEINNGNYKNASSEITVAFWQMLEEYEESKVEYYYGYRSPFFFGSNMTFHTSFFMKIDNDKMGRFIDDVKESISAMQSAIKILSFGFDYRKFTKFDLLSPGYAKTTGGYVLNERGETLCLDDIKWCFDFVIECCMILQNFDYKIINT